MDELRAILSLLTVNGLGSHRILNLHNQFPDIREVLEAPLKHLVKVPGIDIIIAQRIKNEIDNRFVEEQLAFLNNSPFKMITIFDAAYPERLRNIYDPPVVLFMHGDFNERDDDAIAIVGTRNPDHYGKEIAETLVKRLVEQNMTIVSGFARGIDTIAHRTAYYEWRADDCGVREWN